MAPEDCPVCLGIAEQLNRHAAEHREILAALDNCGPADTVDLGPLAAAVEGARRDWQIVKEEFERHVREKVRADC